MINVFELAEACLFQDSITEKLSQTQKAISLLNQGLLELSSDRAIRPIADTLFPPKPELVDPRNLPRRGLGSLQGRIALLHSLAHIEFNAIHLAWDILYRFRGLPAQFYSDWLEVAAEEALHFSLLRAQLRQLGSDYGKLSAHRGLWDVAIDTADDLTARLALVPRTLEARGLDVTPGMIEKLLQFGDAQSAGILQRILEDEVGHVAIGSRWFNTICLEQGKNPEATYFDLVQRLLRGKIHGPLNHTLRKKGGFSQIELERLDRMV